MVTTNHVDGKDKGKIMVYALSTCIWCRKTKELLTKMGVAYDWVDVDQLKRDESMEAQKEIRKWNPPCSFPTMVINGKKCIIGYDENVIKKELG
ncbi:MAG: glutaredoxin family protein [bacterium]